MSTRRFKRKPARAKRYQPRSPKVHAPIERHGLWFQSGVMPPIWLARVLDRYFYGDPPSIYTPKPPRPEPRRPDLKTRPGRMQAYVRSNRLQGKADDDIPF